MFFHPAKIYCGRLKKRTKSNEEIVFLKRYIAAKKYGGTRLVDLFFEWVKIYTTTGDLFESMWVKHTDSPSQTQ